MGPMLIMGISQIRGFEPGDARLGRQARRRPRPGRGEGGGPPRRHPLAVGRGVRERRRQARARPALPRRTRHRQDDARQGDRDRLQLAVRLDPGLGLRADVHRASTRSSFASSRGRRSGSPASGAASASSSSTRSTPSACAAQALGGGAPAGAIRARRHPATTCFYGPHGALNPSGDLILETRRVARAAVRAAGARAGRRRPALHTRRLELLNQPSRA